MSNTGQAWVTLATNDSYALGALVLAQSLKRNNTIHQLAVLITPGVSSAMRGVLASVFDLVKEVDVLDSKDAANLALMARPDLGITFTKLHCWNLTQYTKCVFLDADTLVVKNCDELFEREEISAAPDAGWPDCFNSGVFVYKPSEATFKSLLDFALTHGSFDGGDQGLLNMYFGDWATRDITKHLPFIYNMVATATYSYLPAFKAFGGNVKIAHFIGSSKPWMQALPGGTTLSTFLDLWWDIFLKDVSNKLKTDMIINCTVFEEGPQASKLSTPHPPPPTVQRHVFVDPWDCIQHKQSEQTDSTDLNTRDVIDIMIEHLKLTNQQTESHNSSDSHHVSTPHNQLTYVKQHSAPNLSHNEENLIRQTTHSNILNQPKKTQSLQHLQRPLQNNYGQLYAHKEDIREEPLRRVESYENIPSTISPPSSPSCVEQNSLQSKSEEPTAVSEEGGLAGALAGGQRDVIEDLWRKQSWEQGNIDYMGRDAFENIWKKISQTVENIKPIETPAPQETVAGAGHVPKTEDKTDSIKGETQQVSQPEAPVQPEANLGQSDVAKVENVPTSDPTPTEQAAENKEESVASPQAAEPQQEIPVPPTEAAVTSASVAPAPALEAAVAPAPEPVVPIATEAPISAAHAVAPETTTSKPDVPTPVVEPPTPTEAPAPETPKPMEVSAPETPKPTEVVPAPEATQPTEAVPAPEATKPAEAVPAPEAPKPTEVIPTTDSSAIPSDPTTAGTTSPATTVPAPPADPAVPQPPSTQTTEVPPPQPGQPSTPPSDKKEPSPPKDDTTPPKDGGAEKAAAPLSPSVPSPTSPSAPEGSKVVTQSPASPETQPLTAAETSSPPQTPLGDAPVPPKRSSKKGKAKK